MTTATGYSPLWGNSLSLLVDRNPMKRALGRLMRRMPKDQELMLTLNGAAAGQTAAATRKRVAHSTTELGGVRTIEMREIVNRVTTAGDETQIDADLIQESQPTYASDAKGSWAA